MGGLRWRLLLLLLLDGVVDLVALLDRPAIAGSMLELIGLTPSGTASEATPTRPSEAVGAPRPGPPPMPSTSRIVPSGQRRRLWRVRWRRP